MSRHPSGLSEGTLLAFNAIGGYISERPGEEPVPITNIEPDTAGWRFVGFYSTCKQCNECGRFISKNLWPAGLCMECYEKLVTDKDRMFEPTVSAMRMWLLVRANGERPRT